MHTYLLSFGLFLFNELSVIKYDSKDRLQKNFDQAMCNKILILDYLQWWLYLTYSI